MGSPLPVRPLFAPRRSQSTVDNTMWGAKRSPIGAGWGFKGIGVGGGRHVNCANNNYYHKFIFVNPYFLSSLSCHSGIVSRPGGAMKRQVVLSVWFLSSFVVLSMSLQPTCVLPIQFWNVDKVMHLSAYCWLGLLPALAFPKGRTLTLCALAILCLGGGIEILQGFVPGREPSVADMLANGVGIGLGLPLGGMVRRRFAEEIYL